MIQASLNLSGEHNTYNTYNSYPVSHAGFKTTGTSLEAAESVTPTLKKAHEDLLRLLKAHPNGLTADGAGKMLGWSQFYVRPRFSELHKRNLIKPIGRAKNASGKDANLWGVV